MPSGIFEWLKLFFNQDPLDFEWSFWTEWAKKSLLWTLIGHGVTSRLMSIFCPKVERGPCCCSYYYSPEERHFILSTFLMFRQQFRVQALTIYGVLAAGRVLGVKGVSVLLLHLGLSFSVALLRKPILSWACNLVLLSTLYIQPLQDVQVGFTIWVIMPPEGVFWFFFVLLRTNKHIFITKCKNRKTVFCKSENIKLDF